MIKAIKGINFSIRLIVIFVLFVGFILGIEDLLNWLNIKFENISINDKVNYILLFGSGLVLFWYTKETAEIKRSSVKATQSTIKATEVSKKTLELSSWGLLVVDEEKTKQNTNFAGLRLLRGEDESKMINIRLFLRNDGQGLLKIIKVTPDSFSHQNGYKNGIEQNFQLVPRGFDLSIGKVFFIKDTIELDYMFKMSKEVEGVVSCEFNIYYKDILGEYKHRIKFNHINLQSFSFEIQDKGKICEKNYQKTIL